MHERDDGRGTTAAAIEQELKRRFADGDEGKRVALAYRIARLQAEADRLPAADPIASSTKSPPKGRKSGRQG
ncbi:hypothetical protein [Afifella pfennigii]|uniref:hypothetical protein n=1 Tax=Afifella pfennigii TaxID=209897 RepID=UPI0004796C4F|nr:hypothetical protein [Afifella pfennigii]